MTTQHNKTKRWQFSVRDILNFTLAISVPACFMGYFYRLTAPDGAPLVGILASAFISIPPAIAWVLFAAGRKSVAAMIIVGWVLGLLASVVGRLFP